MFTFWFLKLFGVGKVTPKGETELSPEERLLRAIFGEKAGDVRDSSLKAPPGMKGVILETRMFSRKEKDKKTKKSDKESIEKLKIQFSDKIQNVIEARDIKLSEVLMGETANEIRDGSTDEILLAKGKTFSDANLNSISFKICLGHTLLVFKNFIMHWPKLSLLMSTLPGHGSK